ncbi:MAG: DegT/DnrJ/EryC1/StrS family aminotransferase, partial [Flavobacteriales bacterium]|nr:DegT/DnrJ/EryC1/StrS family aminotransferase [Flavobacteriales bacterium]
SRLDELQAGILRVKLKYLDQWNNLRKEAAQKLKSKFSDKSWGYQSIPEGYNHVYHQLVALTTNRDTTVQKLQDDGFQCQIHYPVPPYKSEAYEKDFSESSFPLADKISNEIFSLPIHGYMWATMKLS